MRLQQSRAPALLLLLPALQVLGASIAAADDTPQARAVVPAYPNVSASPNPTLAPTTGPKGTKDAPFDGQDGMPHAGPYINDEPSPTKKQPALVEELGPKKTIIGPSKPTSSDDKVLDGDKSVQTGSWRLETREPRAACQQRTRSVWLTRTRQERSWRRSQSRPRKHRHYRTAIKNNCSPKSWAQRLLRVYLEQEA
jgi:hypothetical protein